MIDHPVQVSYIRLGAGFVYLGIVMDVFTRRIRGWQLSLALDQELTLAAVRMVLQDGVPEIHHSDQGVRYAANDNVDLLKTHQMQISMAAMGKAEENGYAERFMRTIMEEEVDLSDYAVFADALDQIGRFIEDVNNYGDFSCLHPLIVRIPDTGGVRGRLVGLKIGRGNHLRRPDFVSRFLGPLQAVKEKIRVARSTSQCSLVGAQEAAGDLCPILRISWSDSLVSTCLSGNTSVA